VPDKIALEFGNAEFDGVVEERDHFGFVVGGDGGEDGWEGDFGEDG
jgi:hypothetical protein